MVTEADWLRAQNEELYRQEFIDSIDLDGVQKYVRRITYMPLSQASERAFDDRPTMETEPSSFLTRLGVGGFTPYVRVFPRAFQPYYGIRTLGDFISGLIDHEGYHAKELYETPGLFFPYLLIDVLPTRIINHLPINLLWLRDFVNSTEQRALSNQRANMHKRGLSEEYKTAIDYFLRYTPY